MTVPLVVWRQSVQDRHDAKGPIGPLLRANRPSGLWSRPRVVGYGPLDK